MKRLNLIYLLIYFNTGFTVIHGLLSFLILGNKALYNNISLHYSDNITWVSIFFLAPGLGGLCAYLWLKNKSITKNIKTLLSLLFFLQIAFTGTATIINYNYWGYAFKRPGVFNEILNAESILSCSQVYTTDSTRNSPLLVILDTTESIDNLYGRKDIYYGTSDRVLMAFQDRAYLNGNLYGIPEIYNNPELKASDTLLLTLKKQIAESWQNDNHEKNWETPTQFIGILIEFLSFDKSKYIYAGLQGGQVSNDHYPFYEFLFEEKNNRIELIKKQKFYTDFAGIEGFEYANIAPFFSLLLTIIGTLSVLIIYTINRLLNKSNNSNFSE